MSDIVDQIGILLEKTESGKLVWRRLSSTEFGTTLGETTVGVDKSHSSEIFVKIYDEFGTVLLVEKFPPLVDSDALAFDLYSAAQESVRAGILKRLSSELERV